MKKSNFLEEKRDQLYEGQVLDLAIDYLTEFELFPKVSQSRITRSIDTATVILNHDEAKAILDQIEFCWEHQFYFPEMGLQDKNSIIVFKFDLGDEFEGYREAKIVLKNRRSDSTLSKGEYKYIVTFFE